MNQNKPKILISPQCNENGEGYIGQEYIDFIEDCGGEAILLPLDITEKRLKSIIREYDGVLIPGGNDINPKLYGQKEELLTSADVPKRDKLETILLKLTLKNNIPLLCICRGMQILNIFCGGDLYQNIQKNPYNINHNQHKPYNIPCHTIQIIPNTLLSSIIQTDIIYVNSMHHQGIKKLGSNLKICARAIDGLIEGVYNENYSFCLGIQWHPEQLKDNYSIKIGKHFINKAKESHNKKASISGF